MDSKSIAENAQTHVESRSNEIGGPALRIPCADDRTRAELIALLPQLTDKQVRQMLVLAKSMAE